MNYSIFRLIKKSHFCDSFLWSGRRGSNSRHPPWQGGILPLNYPRLGFLGYFSILHAQKKIASVLFNKILRKKIFYRFLYFRILNRKGKSMSLLHSITKHSSNALNKLPNRFTENGMFLKMGAVKRTPRNNSNSEIIETIKSYADKTPEVKEFVSHIGEMDPKYLGLALDTIELSNISLLTNNNINFLTKSNNNKSILSTILEALPKASKENPEALDLAQTVINNSDVRNSKYFLAKLFSFNISDMKELRPQFGAIKDFIPNLAKEILNPPNPISFRPRKHRCTNLSLCAFYRQRPRA